MVVATRGALAREMILQSALKTQGILGAVSPKHFLALASISANFAVSFFSSFGDSFPGTRLVLGFINGWGIAANIENIKKGKYSRVILQSIFQTAITAFISQSVLKERSPCSAFAPLVDSNSLESFLEKHKNELVDIVQNNELLPSVWEKVGSGMCKTVLEHPSLPGHLFKVSRNNTSCWKNSEFNDAMLEYLGQQDAKEIIKRFSFKHLVVPDSQIVETIAGPVLVERKLEFINPFCQENSESKDAVVEYKNQQDAKEIVRGFLLKHIDVSESQIDNTKTGPDLVEKALKHMNFTDPAFVKSVLEFINFCENLPEGGKEAVAAFKECRALEDIGGFCDLDLLSNRNVKYLKNTGEHSCVGFYDLDCRI